MASSSARVPTEGASVDHPSAIRTSDLPPPSYSFCSIHRRILTKFSIFLLVVITILAIILGTTLGPSRSSASGLNTEDVSPEKQEEDNSKFPNPSTPSPTHSPTSTPSTFTPDWYPIGPPLNGLTPNSEFGFSLSLSRNATRIAIGVPYHDYDRGMVLVYELTKLSQNQNQHWTKIGSFQGQKRGENVGVSVALSSSDGEWLAIGSNAILGTGEVRIMRYNETNEWSQIGDEVVGDGAGDNFGSSLEFSSDGKRLLVASPGGYVRFFKFSSDGKWEKTGNGIRLDETEDLAVTALSSDGSRMAVGFPNEGLVRVYEYVGGWELLGDEDVMGINVEDRFGMSVDLAMEGSRVAIGTDGGNYVLVMDFNENTELWEVVGNIISMDDLGEIQYDMTVSMSEDGQRLAVGMPNYNFGIFNQSGLVRIYELNASSNKWEVIGNDFITKEVGSYTGYAISMSADGGFVAVGAPTKDNGEIMNAGAVNIFQFLDGVN